MRRGRESEDGNFLGRAVSGVGGPYADGELAEAREEVEATGTSREAIEDVDCTAAVPFCRRVKGDPDIRDVGTAVAGCCGTGGIGDVSRFDISGLVESAIGGTDEDTAAAADVKERADDDALDGRRPRPGLREDGGICSLLFDGVAGRLRIGGVDTLSGISVAV